MAVPLTWIQYVRKYLWNTIISFILAINRRESEPGPSGKMIKKSFIEEIKKRKNSAIVLGISVVRVIRHHTEGSAALNLYVENKVKLEP